jgi:hypothetical protein
MPDHGHFFLVLVFFIRHMSAKMNEINTLTIRGGAPRFLRSKKVLVKAGLGITSEKALNYSQGYK